MSFLHPEYFYYFLPIIIVFFIYLLKKQVSQAQFFSDEVMEKLRVVVNTLSLQTRNKIFFVIAILLVISLAEPVIEDGVVEVKSKSADIMIALDISDSMLAEDVYPNRLKFAKQKAMDLLNLAPQERIGVVAFAKNSYLVSPMSFDHGAVTFLLRQLSTDSITEKGTDLMALLNVVVTTIKKEGKKHLLVLSDGGDKEDFSQEIEFAKENNIVVYILGIGTDKGAPIKQKDGSFIKYKGEIIVSRLNENISKLATSSSGVYIKSVKSDDDVKAMLREINRNSKQKELQVEEVQKFIPLFYYPLYVAMLLLLITTSSFGKKANASVGLMLIALFVSAPKVNAGLLDFIDLEDAKKAYISGDYEKSQKMYTKYANETNSSEGLYNKGNSLYKQNKYEEAIQAYSQAKFDDNISKANTLANIGNSHVKQAKTQSLENAMKSYEESLKYNEDKDVRENLEAVKKEIEKQKKENKEKDKDKQKNKDKNEQDNNSDKEKSKEGEESDEKKDSKDKNSNEKEKQKEEDKKKKEDSGKLNEDSEDNNGTNKAQQMPQKGEMSDAEQEKWLNKLNAEQNTFMYMLNKNDKSNEEHLDEKPW